MQKNAGRESRIPRLFGLLLVSVLQMLPISSASAFDTIQSIVEFLPVKMPSSKTVKSFSAFGNKHITFDLNSHEKPSILSFLRQQCGWLDPLILAEVAELNGFDSISDQTISSLNEKTNIQFPTCLYISPATIIYQNAMLGKSSPIKAPSLSKYLSEKHDEIKFALSRAMANSGHAIQYHDEDKLDKDYLASVFETANMVLASHKNEGNIEKRREAIFEKLTRDYLERIINNTDAATEALSEARSKLVTKIAPSAYAPQRCGMSQEKYTCETLDSSTWPEFSQTWTETAKNISGALLQNEAAIAATGIKVNTYIPKIIGPANSPSDEADCRQGAPADTSTRSMSWPLNEPRIVDALLLNAFERAVRRRTLGSVVILVADTGFPIDIFTGARQEPLNNVSLLHFFSQSDFYPIADELGQPSDPGSWLDQNGDGYKGNVYGFSLQKTNGEIKPAANYEYAHHGMGVASLAIGGAQFSRFRMTQPIHLALHFANIMFEEGSSVRMSGDKLSEIVRYLNYNKLDIANFSFTSNGSILDLENQIASADRTLFVVAAGNDGLSLDVNLRSPAVLGGSLPGKGGVVITVGALREDNTAARFSNYSSVHVDVFAPGCYMPVPMIDSNGIHVELQHGTSFAAPIVSFVAAMLRSEGLGAAEIKRRIVLSSVQDESLKTKARYGARLDAEAALMIYNDLISLKPHDGIPPRRLRGHVETMDQALPCRDFPIRYRDMFRLSFAQHDETKKESRFNVFLRVYRGPFTPTYEEQPRECVVSDSEAPNITLFDVDELQKKKIPLTAIESIIVRDR